MESRYTHTRGRDYQSSSPPSGAWYSRNNLLITTIPTTGGIKPRHNNKKKVSNGAGSPRLVASRLSKAYTSTID